MFLARLVTHRRRQPLPSQGSPRGCPEGDPPSRLINGRRSFQPKLASHAFMCTLIVISCRGKMEPLALGLDVSNLARTHFPKGWKCCSHFLVPPDVEILLRPPRSAHFRPCLSANV